MASGVFLADRVARRNRSRFLTAMVILAFAGSVSGCSTDRTVPVFTTPIQWSGTSLVALDGSGEGGGEAAFVLRLGADEAWVSNFPQGKTIEDSEGYYCFDRLGTEFYTGKASWSVVSGHLVKIDFGESSVVVVSSRERFTGDQDWSDVRIDGCGGEPSWYLGYDCGDSGYGHEGDAGKGGPFREPCTEP